MSMLTSSNVFGVRISRNDKTCQISHYWYLWGQPMSVTSDDLWKVNMQCQRSHVVMCWPKSCIISPFLLVAASCVAENTISLKTGQRLYLLWHHSSVTWPDPVNFFQKLRKGCPISHAKFQCDQPRGSAVISEKLMGSCIITLCTGED